MLETQLEILKQMVGNMSFFALPAIITGANKEETIHPAEIAGFLIFFCAWLFEATADVQKRRFMNKCLEEGKTN